MQIIIMKRISLLLISILLFGASYSQKHNVLLNLKAGTTYYQTSVSNASIHQVIDGSGFDMTTTIAGSISFKVLSQTDSVYELQTSYDSLAMTIKLPQGVTYFSSSSADNIFSMIVSRMKGHPFKVHMYKTGAIKSITGIEELIEKAISAVAALPEQQVAQIKQQLLQAYGEKSFKGSFETVTNILPGKQVGLNEKWEVVTNMESMMAAKRLTTYTLTGVDETHFTIEGSTTMQTEDKDAYMQIAGSTPKYNLKGKATSKFIVDKKTGWVLKATADDIASGNVEMKDANGSVTTIPITIQSSMDITGK